MTDLPKYLIGAILGLVLGLILSRGGLPWVLSYEGCYKRYVLGAASNAAASEGTAYCQRKYSRTDRPG